MRGPSVNSEVRWVVRLGGDGHAWHHISLVAHNLGTRNRAEVSSLSVALPRGLQFDKIRGQFNRTKLDQGELYLPEAHMLAIDLEKYVQPGSTGPAKVSFQFRQPHAVQQSGGRQHISFSGFSPTGLRASAIELVVSLPPYKGLQRAIAFLHCAVRRHSLYDAQGRGLTLSDVQPTKRGLCAFSPPPPQGTWSHRLEYDWVDLGRFALDVFSFALGFLVGVSMGIVANIVFWLLVQK